MAGLAAWVGAGAVTVASSEPGAARFGLLPSPLWLIASLAAAAAFVALARYRPLPAPLLAVSALLLLPWLPFGVPPALLIWAGHVATWIWLGIAAAFVAPLAWRAAPKRLRAIFTDPRDAPRAAAAIATALYLGGVGAHLLYAHAPAGDEPHYLVIAQSLLLDHDLKIENNHRRGDYHAYFSGPLKPDYLQRGLNGEIYSVHAPGLPAIVAPAFAAFGYPGVLAFLAVVVGASTGFAWSAVWRLTADAAASWFGWAAVALSAPFFFQAFAIYPDGPGAAIVMVAVTTLMAGRTATAKRLAATGALLAVLPWLHTRFAIAAAVLAAAIGLRQLHAEAAVRRLLAFAAVPVASAAAWLIFFHTIYGTIDPRAPYGGLTQTTIANLPGGTAGLLFDQQFGLFPNAPIYLCAVLGFGALARRSPRLAVELSALLLAYGAAVAAYAIWWAGYSSPARFLVPVLPPLSIPAGVWFYESRGAVSRVLGLGALTLSALITGTLASVGGGDLLFNARDGASLLLLWMSPLVNVSTALPSLFQTGPAAATARAAAWLAALGLTALAGRAAARRLSRAGVAAVVGLTFGTLAMLTATVVWRANHARPITALTGTTALLEAMDSDSGQVAVQLAGFRRVALSDLPRSLTLVDAKPGSIPASQPLALIPQLPSGIYAIEGRLAGPASGRVTVTLDYGLGPQWSWDLGGASGAWQRTIDLPVPVPALELNGDAAARKAIAQITMRAAAVAGSRHRVDARLARRVGRYGPAVVFLVDGRAYAERGGAWIEGGASADFVLAPDHPGLLHLFVRNSPVANRILLEGDDWRQDLQMRPGEEKVVDLRAADSPRGVRLRVTAARGARPSEFAPGSTDTRLLGCWIETRE